MSGIGGRTKNSEPYTHDKGVMLDEDLAEMYKVETKRLNEQVKRNINRFPKDFMFTLTSKEYINLKSQCDSKLGRKKKLTQYIKKTANFLFARWG